MVYFDDYRQHDLAENALEKTLKYADTILYV